MKKTKGGRSHYINKYGRLSNATTSDSEWDEFLKVAFQAPKKGTWAQLLIDGEWVDYEFDGKEWIRS